MKTDVSLVDMREFLDFTLLFYISLNVPIILYDVAERTISNDLALKWLKSKKIGSLYILITIITSLYSYNLNRCTLFFKEFFLSVGTLRERGVRHAYLVCIFLISLGSISSESKSIFLV